MAVVLEIAEQSCALLLQHADGKHTFLGTAFYFEHGGRTLAATAAHCIPKDDNSRLCTVGDVLPLRLRFVSIGVLDSSLDLCLLVPADPPASVQLVLAGERLVEVTEPAYCYEYSTTSFKDGSWHINPASRVGNFVRLVQMEDRYGSAGKDMLEMSFPAIKGASGAPVIQIRDGQAIVVGVVVANAEHHLLPAHIETVLSNNNNLVEERKYFLPQALAVHVLHLVGMADRWIEAYEDTSQDGT
jgi:hypothetical protein